ncbi:ABC transporter permease [Nonomuraea sp. NPDC050556]|uniref:ABC transporter permease n=1 Tax=Nonomuraea sp. NPDC050556 TaxID=3364369 RepID=UPI0037A0C33F
MWITPALRLSRRGLLRSKRRSALTMVMIGLPICLITGVLTLRATLAVSPSEEAPALVAESAVEVRLDHGFERVHGMEVDLRTTGGMRTLSSGRLPSVKGEVVVTPRLSGRQVLETRQGARLRVVGVIDHPNKPNTREIVALPGTMTANTSPQWLPQPVTGPWLTADYVDPLTVIMDGAEAVMAMLVTVLTAGPGFAVGFRGRRDELAVITAQGGSARHVRMVALADGLTLGGLAAPLAGALGIGAALLVAPLAARWTGTIGPPDVPWSSVRWMVVLGLVSAVIAALLPALGLRVRPRGWLPGLGLFLLLAGVAVAVGALWWTWSFDWFRWIFAAAVLGQLGLVALTPWLVGVSGRIAARLGLPLRLAVRDAVRHRVRTACAVAAVSAATASAIAAGVAISSNQRHYRESYVSSVPLGTLSISGRGLDDAGWARLRSAVSAALPGVPVVAGREATAMLALEPLTCVDRCRSFAADELPVGDASLLELLQGRRDPVAVAALAAGKAVVFDGRAVRGGRVTVGPITLPAVVAVAADPAQGGGVLPAGAVEAAGLRTAERRLYVAGTSRVADPEGARRAARVLQGDLRAAAGRATVRVELGYQTQGIPYLWAVLGAAAVLVLGATFAATGLAAADLRPDLEAMAAVGARRGTLRLVVGAQAGYIAGLGALVGAVAGLVTGTAFAWPFTEWEPVGVSVDMSAPPFTEPGWPTIGVPWLLLVAVCVGLPVLAALTTAALASPPPPGTRRR